MNRRTFLAASSVAVAGLSGCLNRGSGSGSSSYPMPEDGNVDGYPPEFDEKPKKKSFDPSSFDTKSEGGEEVPLVPTDIVYNWYKRGEARFADARGTKQYKTSHIYGAVLSPAPGVRGAPERDPVLNWPKSDRIVCYCGCPHHLSSIRASALMQKGYENVFVIDEGFWEWHDRDYPIRGSNTSYNPVAYIISGVTDAAFAGKTAWARQLETGQNEATDILTDGSYTLELKFEDVTADSMVHIETPEYTVKGTIGDLSSRVVSGE
ncbi:Rhodanese-related sulfurtransferase [Haladaptatus paucihalophilus DX253]|uniref:Rhodanese-related sulfurtransferase n=2 Tax=Haladaptatus paucihalophilus DX253 TaxID=797209 RepID=A0A1M6PGD0_HALPU|nr:Rhodanese-related sulfurtransferase [Haladaptatus paucihalophilus DX253]